MSLIDSEGTIVAVNDDWMELARETGFALHNAGSGANYLEICRRSSESSETARRALAGLEGVLRGKLRSFEMEYSCRTRRGQAYFRMAITPIAFGEARFAIDHIDITAAQLSKEEDLRRLRKLARRLITAQEEERQRISQELHDDLGHRIALMSFSLRRFMKQSQKALGTQSRELNKLVEGITGFSTAVRNLSHGLYPPSLRFLGLRAALEALGHEFEETYGIQLDLDSPSDLPRIGADEELCLFRIVQESLQNIAKHSGARKVRLVLDNPGGKIRLSVSDTGKGFIRSEVMKKGGLGLLSMEERALSIGAALTINSSPASGTEIELTLPLKEKSTVTAEQVRYV
jgi:signal transduction histidine kinase